MKLLVLCVVFSSVASASDITGVVTERARGTPLAGAHVTVIGTQKATSTDSLGEFRITGLEPGTYSVRASYIGFEPQTRDVVLRGDSSVSLAFALTAKLIPAQPITVTATRGRERETPATFSTLELQAIRERYSVQDIPVLLSELPSTTYYSEIGTGLGYTYLNIRGFDARRIAVMVNGIPQNDPEDHNVYWVDFPDLAASLEDVQVQRGAGSAFYGPPAIGGSVNVVTSNFSRERAIALAAGWGSYNTRRFAASVSSGLLADRYALHARLASIATEGYREQSWVKYTSYFLGASRYDETMTTEVHFYGGPIADGLAYFGIPRSDIKNRDLRRRNYSYWEPGYFVSRRPEEQENFSQPHYELLHEWRLSPRLTLNNTLFYIYGDGFFDYDGSWAPYSYYRLTPAYGFPVPGDPDTLLLPDALIRAQVTNRQVGWLPRVTILHEGGELILGGELRIHRSLHWGRLQWYAQSLVEVPYDYRYYEYRGAKDMASLYAHEMYTVRPDLTLMLDLQYAYNKYRLYDEKFIGTEFAVPYHFLNPRVGVNYNLTPQWNIYASAAYTSREPRLKNLYDAAEASTPATWGSVVPQFEPRPEGGYDFTRPLVHPEHLMNVELGAAYRGDVGTAGLNLYWMEFTDEIVNSGQLDRFGQPITGNAERTRHVGIELTGRASLGSGFEVSANATASRNRLIRHTDYSTGSPVKLDGNPIAGFPDLLANARLTYRKGPFLASISGRAVGKQYADNFRTAEGTVDPYIVSDLWVSYRITGLVDGVSLGLRAQINNVFNHLYAAYGAANGTTYQFFVGGPRHGFLTLSLEV